MNLQRWSTNDRVLPDMCPRAKAVSFAKKHGRGPTRAPSQTKKESPMTNLILDERDQKFVLNETLRKGAG